MLHFILYFTLIYLKNQIAQLGELSFPPLAQFPWPEPSD
jgi:hypothetical protein